MGSDAVEVARRLAQQRFPQARAVWLGGSVADGTATATSDLDLTVLLGGPPAPYRESTTFEGWPVELFVQTEASLLRFCERDVERRRPTTMRLVGSSVIVVDADGAGRDLQARLRGLDQDGPRPATADELETARYVVTDLLDDLTAPRPGEDVVVAAQLLTAVAELLLLVSRRWSGSGKWLLRELRSLDAELGTDYAQRLCSGVRSVALGDAGPMLHTAQEIQDLCGGRLFDGYRRDGARITTASPPADSDAD